MRYRFQRGDIRQNAIARGLATALAAVLLAAPLSACSDQSNASHVRAAFVRTEHRGGARSAGMRNADGRGAGPRSRRSVVPGQRTGPRAVRGRRRPRRGGRGPRADRPGRAERRSRCGDSGGDRSGVAGARGADEFRTAEDASRQAASPPALRSIRRRRS